MKKIVLAYLLITLACYSSLKAQVISNGGFEDWTSTGYLIPDVTPPTLDFLSSNTQTFSKAGILGMTRVAGNGGGYAMELKTLKYNNNGQPDSSVAYAVWGGNPGNGSTPIFPGGFPFNDQNVTGMGLDLAYSINANSPGVVLVQFKKNGVPIGGGNAPLNMQGVYAFPLTGSTSGAFITVPLTFSPALPSAPDTCVIAFASNNPFGGGGNGGIGYPGDSLVVDNIVFTGTTITVPDGNLESWINLNIETPTKWSQGQNGGGVMAYQTTDAHSGTYAVALPVADSSDAQLSLGQNICSNTNCTQIPGMSLSGTTPTYLDFYYKMSSPGKDTAQVQVVLTKWNGAGNPRSTYPYYLKLTPQSSYTYTTLPLTSPTPVAVDSAYIEIDASWSSAGNSNGAVNGSLLLIDDMSFDGLPIPTGIFAAATSTSSMNVYPSPASSIVTVETTANIANVTVLNTLQQEVNARVISVSGNKAVVDLSTLNPGLYIIRMSDGQTLQAQKVIKQ